MYSNTYSLAYTNNMYLFGEHINKDDYETACLPDGYYAKTKVAHECDQAYGYATDPDYMMLCVGAFHSKFSDNETKHTNALRYLLWHKTFNMENADNMLTDVITDMRNCVKQDVASEFVYKTIVDLRPDAALYHRLRDSNSPEERELARPYFLAALNAVARYPEFQNCVVHW